jgi:hypothetical protein
MFHGMFCGGCNDHSYAPISTMGFQVYNKLWSFQTWQHAAAVYCSSGGPHHASVRVALTAHVPPLGPQTTAEMRSFLTGTPLSGGHSFWPCCCLPADARPFLCTPPPHSSVRWRCRSEDSKEEMTSWRRLMCLHTAQGQPMQGSDSVHSGKTTGTLYSFTCRCGS